MPVLCTLSLPPPITFYGPVVNLHQGRADVHTLIMRVCALSQLPQFPPKGPFLAWAINQGSMLHSLLRSLGSSGLR